jgi:hypothetical protein
LSTHRGTERLDVSGAPAYAGAHSFVHSRG